jgi:site-specific DNA recombinase
MNASEAAGMRLAIYARVSTEEQREGQTIDSQIAELERFAREKAFVVTGVYRDDGWSGGIMARPDLDRLRDDSRTGLFQAVLINDVDRLARDVSHLGIIKRDLEKQGVRIIFRKLPSEASPTYNLMVNILGSFAEFEREMIVDRTRRGRRHKIEVRKQYLGSNTAYGYRWIPADKLTGTEGRLEINPAEAPTIRRIFEWVDKEGLSARRVINRLNELRIPSQKGKRWGRSSVLRLLHNETYAGIWHYNKLQGCEPTNPVSTAKYRRHTKSSRRKRPREEWLALELSPELRLVARDRWERVQDRIRRNIAFSPRHEKHFYLLKGLVHCGSCGSRYVGSPCHGKFYYRCMARCHRQPTIRDQTLDNSVISTVERLITNPSLILNQIERLKRTHAESGAFRHRLLAEVEKELRQIESEEARLLEAYRSAIITATQLGSELSKLTTRRTDAESRRAEFDTKPAVSPETVQASIEEFCHEIRRGFRSFAPEELREFLRTVVRDVVFDGQQIRILGHLPAVNHGAGASIKPSEPDAKPSRFADGLHPPAALNTAPSNDSNQVQEERIARERCNEEHGQEVQRACGRCGTGRRGVVYVKPATRIVLTPEVKEVTAAGVLWGLTVTAKAVSQDVRLQPRDAFGRFGRDCAHSGKAE